MQQYQLGRGGPMRLPTHDGEAVMNGAREMFAVVRAFR
jgi:hypothetical protein